MLRVRDGPSSFSPGPASAAWIPCSPWARESRRFDMQGDEAPHNRYQLSILYKTQGSGSSWARPIDRAYRMLSRFTTLQAPMCSSVM